MCKLNYRFLFRYNDRVLGTYGNPRFSGMQIPDAIKHKNVMIALEYVNIQVKNSDLSGKKEDYITMHLKNAIFENNFKNENRQTIASNNIAVIPLFEKGGTYTSFKYLQDYIHHSGPVINIRNFNFDNLEFEFRDSSNILIPPPQNISATAENYIIVINFIVLEE